MCFSRMNQCDGVCDTGQSCQPVKTQKTLINVTVTALNATETIESVTIDEHRECQCQCITKREVRFRLVKDLSILWLSLRQ